MVDQKLIYTIEGDATGLKKAMAESEAAYRRLTDALSRKIGEIGAFKSGQAELARLGAALDEAKRKRDFFLRSAEVSGSNAFARDIAQAKAEVLRLADAMQRQRAAVAATGTSLKVAGVDVTNLAGAEAKLRAAMDTAGTSASKQTAALRARFAGASEFRASLDQVRDSVARLRTAFAPLLATLAAGFSARGLVEAADGYNNLQARLKLAARSQEEFAASTTAVERIASAAQAPLAETAQLYTRIASSLKDTDVSQSAFVDTVEAVALALRVSGASASEQSSAMLQFSQAIASGVLRGEELNAVFESAPRLMQALAQALGKPVGALREMAKEGQLTREVLIDSLAKELPTLRREAESLPQTVGAAFTELGNTVLLTAGRIDQAMGASAGLAKSLKEFGGPAVRTAFEALAVIGANVAFVFKTIGREIGAVLAAQQRFIRGDFKGAAFILKEAREDSRRAREDLDALERRILQPAVNREAAPAGAASTPQGSKPSIATQADRASRLRLDARRREMEALAAAEEALENARAEAAAQGLADSLATRREQLDQARKAELIDEAGFIAAKAALDEEALRNELAALQAQQAKLRAASVAPGAKASEKTQALADLALVDARIESASQKIRNLSQAAAADLAGLAAAKLRAQAELIDGLEQEAFLADLSNDARETALLLLEAEKLGITDVNRLLELQGQIRQANADKQAKEELQRQQDDLYKSVQQGVQRAFADGLNAVATGAGGFREALSNLVGMIRNALSNALAASLTDSFLGMLGGKQGVLGGLASMGIGAKRDGSSPTSAVYVQDVNKAATAATGADGETGGMFSWISDIFTNLMASLKAGLTSLVSGFGDMLGGLFGDAGGGQNWIGAIASMFGFADGGYTGAGGKYQPAGVVHAGEYVFSAESVRRLGLGALDNLHRIAKGGFVPTMPRFGYAEGGLVNLPGSAPPTVNASTKVVNMFDLDSAFAEYLNTRHGERAILNVIQRNPGVAGG